MVLMAKIFIKDNNFDFAEKILLDCLEYSENFFSYNKIFCL